MYWFGVRRQQEVSCSMGKKAKPCAIEYVREVEEGVLDSTIMTT